MTIPGETQAGIIANLEDVYTGATINVRLTNGLTYGLATVLANVTAAQVATNSAVGPSATFNATTEEAEILDFTVNIDTTTHGGSANIVYDGFCLEVGGEVRGYVDFEGVDQTITHPGNRDFIFNLRNGIAVVTAL